MSRIGPRSNPNNSVVPTLNWKDANSEALRDLDAKGLVRWCWWYWCWWGWQGWAWMSGKSQICRHIQHMKFKWVQQVGKSTQLNFRKADRLTTDCASFYDILVCILYHFRHQQLYKHIRTNMSTLSSTAAAMKSSTEYKKHVQADIPRHVVAFCQHYGWSVYI